MKTIENISEKQLHDIPETVEVLKNKCTILEHENQELATKLKWYEEQFRLSQSKRFGASSEKTSLEQLALFNEAEKTAHPKAQEPTVEEITYNLSLAT